jgi:hypothetical protein
MRALACLVFVVAGDAAATAQPPQAIIDRAVKAHGGADALAKTKAMVQSAKGRVSINGVDVEATREARYALPERYSWLLELKPAVGKQRRLIVRNGLSGWQQVDNQPAEDIPTLLYDIISEEGYVLWLCTVAPLGQAGFTFAPAPAADVEGQPAAGVLVTRTGRTDVTLHFHGSSGLLVKCRFVSRAEPGAVKEWFFSRHKDFAGVKLPTRLIDRKNADRLGDWDVTDYKFVDRFDAATFKRP